VKIRHEGEAQALSPVVTGTHVYASIADPTQVSGEELRGMDGIGMLRSEFMLRLL